ncbi:MAG: hypothetical protein HY273_00190 [Gammaproteobacteria bacterium]|nr:hypothetical protein [Gammaproteobacteria bacterium]
MELSSEDELRLQVLLANAEAIRIDEQRMVVCGLSTEREFEVQLTPMGSADRYLHSITPLLKNSYCLAVRKQCLPWHVRHA